MLLLLGTLLFFYALFFVNAYLFSRQKKLWEKKLRMNPPAEK